MDFNIDALIFVAFLAATFFYGLYHSVGISNIRNYSIGDRNFSTATLVMTIVATWVGGEFFFAIIYESYTQGLNFIWPSLLSDFLWPLIVGIIFAPRLGEFLGTLSIAEAMGNLFGKHVRLITAVAGCIGVIGIISMQLKVAGVLFENALGIQGIYGVIVSGVIVTLYASLGGIKSVTFTDIIQVLTFGIIIPALAYFLFYGFENNQLIIDTVNTNPLFDIKKVFDFSAPSTYYTIILFLYFIIPSFNPAIFQRIAMAKNTKQVQHSFTIAALICFLLSAALSWIAILILSTHQGLNEEEMFKNIISNSMSIVGFKGIVLAGIMAMVMSTVDSYINSSAVLLIHDVRNILGLKVIKNELFTTRLCALFIGFAAIFFSMSTGSFVQLFMWANMFYMPVVSVPFIFAVFGFRSSSKSVLIGMLSGVIIAIIWELFVKIADIGGVMPGMVANTVALFGFHYFLRQPGGWVGIKNPEPINESKKLRVRRVENVKNYILTFNLLRAFKKNTPKGEGFIALVGLFIMISNFSSIVALPDIVRINYAFILDILYPVTLCLATGLMSYPLWIDEWKKTNFLPYFWNTTIFLVLICFNLFTVLINNFAEMQLMVFMINVAIVCCILSWRLALGFVLLGTIVAMILFNLYYYPLELYETASVKFKIVYLLFLIISTLVIFLKPKQEYLEATEAKVDTLENEVTHLDHELIDLSGKVMHYSQRISDHEKEIERLGSTAQKILNNVNHELRLPIGNVVNFSDMLHETLQKSDDKILKDLSEEVFKNSTRVSTMILNMLDLATLEVKKVDLNKKTINFGELVEGRVKRCRKIYLQGKKIDFELSIQPEVMITVDPDYIRQMVDNIVINSLTYSTEGKINVYVYKVAKRVELIIEDQGIGIPLKDIYDIFDPFKMGSKTESKAEGRGIGLALCKSVAEAHGGKITAESDGKKGAKFTVVFPFYD